MRLFALLLALLTFVGAPAHADTISIRADIWCPYNCKPTDKKPGYAIEIVKEVLEKAGHTVDYQIMPWAESVERTRKNEFTAIIGAGVNDAPDFVFPKEPVGLSSTSYASLAERKLSIKSVADLADKSLGVIDAYSYNETIDDYIAKNKNNPARIASSTGDDALDINIQKLLAKNVDVICEDTNVLFYKTNKSGVFSKLTVSLDPNKLTDIHLAFSPKHPKAKEYAALLDKGIAELRSSGKLKVILQKYGLSDWKAATH